MTTLSRVTGKVFGGSAPLDEIGQFGSAKAGTKLNTQDVATIQALPAYSTGWGSAIMTSRNFPPIEEVTGVLKTISYQNCYLLQEGIPEYDSGTNYSNTSIVKSINGTGLKFFISLQNDNQGHALSDSAYWAEAVLDSGRKLGEIVTSTIPLSDAGLHLLDGTLISGSGIYADFVTYIASIYNSSLNYFCTESQWQASVSQYGVCGKFVYNSTNNTVRLPKVTGFIEGASGTSTLGNLTQAGLPNITGWMKATGVSESPALIQETTGAFTAGNEVSGGNGHIASTSGAYYQNINFNASLSSSIYGNSSTVQPQSVKVLYYIVVATSTKTSIEVDIDEIATDLNGKMDKDGLNAVNSVKFADGQWVVQETELSTATAVGTYNIDLSNVLPNDNYKYECIFKYSITRIDSSANNSYYNAGVTVNNVNVEFATDCVQGGVGSTDEVRNGGVFTMPIGTNRSMFIIISVTALKYTYTKLVAYRRIGTNQ